ncbi:hypothetical protein D0Z07_1466 [Hyphodiscus hymeniophilus]|uniref:Uncharacterized protein n=1 Tax=Hyphodiscus hymeniophilus TaxID=353542 RepID=A0A9P6VQ20_9HELO|nr:hypothetical protein D0Z07_1466 [Hyphodiscus hymeniophilus]
MRQSVPPPYVTVSPASMPPPYTPPQSMVYQPFFYPIQTPAAPTFQHLQPASTIPPQQASPQQAMTLFSSPIIPNNTILSIPSFVPNNAVRVFQTPPPFPPFFPGQVPSWVPRETRYELHRGVLTPVEHFAGPTTLHTGRGWNPIHGYDTGPLPPSTGGGIALANLARSLNHAADSSAGSGGGDARSQPAGVGTRESGMDGWVAVVTT